MEKKKLILIISFVLIGLFLTISISYAIFSFVNSSSPQKINSGRVSLSYQEADSIKIAYPYPVSDEVGRGSEYYFDFTISSNSTGVVSVPYEINYTVELGSSIPLEYVKVHLSYQDESSVSESFPLSGVAPTLATFSTPSTLRIAPKTYVLHNDTFNLEGNDIKKEKKYRLRIWVSDQFLDIEKNSINITLNVDSNQVINLYTDDECFTFNSGVISAYDSSCGTIVIIPPTIGGEKVKSIGASAFEQKGLTYLDLPEGIETIYKQAFHYNSIETIVIPDSVTAIGTNAFARNNISKLVLNDKVTNYPEGVFAHNKITELTLKEGVTTLGWGAFYDNLIHELNLPNTVNSMGNAVFNDNELPDKQAFIYDRLEDGSINYNRLRSYGGAKRDNVVIPAKILDYKLTYIVDEAFVSCNMTSITLPEGLETIGRNVFTGNNLTTLTIPSTVKTITEKAISVTSSNNPNLTTIINKTNRAFDWNFIIGGTSSDSFITGTAVNGTKSVNIIEG